MRPGSENIGATRPPPLVLITGAASGIGRALAQAYATQGARLALCDIDPRGLAAVASQIATPCHLATLDVADAPAVETFAQAILATTGVPDILVNNAGIALIKPFLQTGAAEWQRVMDVNLGGAVHVTRAFLPAMLAAGGARRIVNVASLAGLVAGRELSAYCAGKHALIGFSDALALELAGSDVGITLVCPGLVNTGILDPLDDPRKAAWQTLAAKYGTPPETIARAIVAAVARNQARVHPGRGALFWPALQRLSPALTRRLILALTARQRETAP